MRIEEAIFRRIKQLVIERTLHHYYENKDDQLRDRLHRRLAATGLAPELYLRALESGDAEEWSRLETEITINETFFFRFAEQFDSLRDTILPALVAARAHTRRLRIWSAGCSTGAEPYSVAILLRRLLGEAVRDWSITILGTDIDEAALRTARAGEYNDWALRSLPAAERRRDFVPMGEGKAQRWSLRPAFRGMVRFEKHNLLDSLRSTPKPGEAFDLILCRNVLIYFHQDTVRDLVRRFGAALAVDGWLLLGHAEAVGHTLEALRPVSLDGTVVWRRTEPDGLEPTAMQHAAPVSRPQASQTMAPPFKPTAKPIPRSVSGRIPRRPTAAVVPTPPDTAPPDTTPMLNGDGARTLAVDAVRDLADRGLPNEALAACRAGLEAHPLSAELFFYAALLNRAMDRNADAETDFRRALYLRKSFVMAHYHLGLLLNDTGRPGPGRRAVAEARRIAGEMGEDAPLLCGDGITAGRLRVLSRLTVPDGIEI